MIRTGIKKFTQFTSQLFSVPPEVSTDTQVNRYKPSHASSKARLLACLPLGLLAAMAFPSNAQAQEVQFKLATSSTSEIVSTVNVEVEISPTAGVPISVPYTFDVSSTAQGGGTDYTDTGSGTVVIPAGMSSVFIPLAQNNEDIYEQDETVVIVLGTVSAGATNGTANQIHTLTVVSEDPVPTATFAPTVSSSADEEDGTQGLTVTLSNRSAYNTNVAYSLGGTAAEGGANDYTDDTELLLTIPALATSGDIELTINDDVLFENTETATATLQSLVTAGDAGTIDGANDTYTLSINDNDPLPKAKFSVTSSNVDEDNGAATNIQVEINAQAGVDVNVPYMVNILSTADGGGVDYTDTTAGNVLIPAGQLTANLQITPVDDMTFEDDESVLLELTLPSATAAADSSNQSHDLNIVEDDTPPPVDFDAASSVNAEGAGTVNVTLSLDALSDVDEIITYSLSGDAVGGGTDYTNLSPNPITIPAGQMSVDIQIAINDDAIDEANTEDLTITLDSVVEGMIGTNNVHTFSITDNDAPPEIFFNPTTFSSPEGGTVGFRVFLTAVSGLDVTVPYTFNGTSTATGGGVDYTDNTSGSIVISAGSLDESVVLAEVDDMLDEDDETIVVDLGVPTNATNAATNQQLVVTLTDNDAEPTVTFSAPTQTNSEGDVVANVEVTLDVLSGRDVTVTYSVAGGTATGGGTDYTDSTTPSIVIPEGSLTATIDITPNDDALDENDETVELSIDSAVNGAVGGASAHTLTLTDNDLPPEINFVGATATNSEADGGQLYTVMLDAVSELPVTVNYSISGTVNGTDYTDNDGGSIVIPASSMSGDISITLLDDALDEDDNESLVITIDSVANATLGAGAVFTQTVTDNDAIPELNFNPTVRVSTEADGSIGLVVEVTPISGRDITVPFTLGGDAVVTEDYDLPNGLSLTIPALAASASISVDLLDDLLDENAETAVYTLGAPDFATVGAGSALTLTINDNDAAPSVNFNEATLTVTEATVTEPLVVELDAVSGLDVTVNYTIAGTATVGGVDINNSAMEMIVIPAGSTSGNIDIDVLTDAIDELDETVTVTFSSFVNGQAGAGPTQSHTLTILDDDNPPEVDFSLSSSSYPEGNTLENIQVELDAPSGLDVTVNYAFDGLTSTASDSGGNIDFTDVTTGSVVILAGSTTANIQIQLADDAVFESDETIVLDLGIPGNGTNGSGFQTHTLTMTNDETPPIVNFAAATSNPGEAVGTTTVTVSLTGETELEAQIPYQIMGTASGADYTDDTVGAPSLTIPAGLNPSATINLTIADDLLDEDDETLVFSFGPAAATNATTLGTTTATHTMTVADNDVEPTVTFSAPTQSNDEGDGTANVEVTLDTLSGRDVTVTYSVAGGTAAGAGMDYTDSTAPSIIIPEGSLTGTIDLALNDDALDENNETVDLTLDSAVNGGIGGANAHTLTINDNDDAPEINFAPTSATNSEADGLQTYTVTLSALSELDVTVDYAFAGTVDGSDYTDGSGGQIVILAGNPSGDISVTLNDDALNEDPETLTLTISSADLNATVGANNVFTQTINDNDALPVVQFLNPTSGAAEGAVGQTAVTVSMAPVSGRDVTVFYDVNGGLSTATDTDDYTDDTAPSVTIPAGSTTANILISMAEDVLFEGDEDIVLDLNAGLTTTASLGAQAQNTFTIVDNDGPPQVLFNISSGSANENVGVVNIQIDQTSISGLDTDIDFSVDAGGTTALDPADYTLLTASPVTIPAGQTTVDIQLSLNDDTLFELDETIKIDIDAVTGGAAAATPNQSHVFTLANDVISDDPPPVVTFTSTAVTTGENTGTTFIMVQLDALSGLDTVINYTFDGASEADSGDFNDLTAGEIIIPAGSFTNNIEIALTDDALNENSEDLIINLTSVDNGYGQFGMPNDPFVLTITDSGDALPIAEFAGPASGVLEPDGAVAVRVDITPASGRDVDVDYTVAGSATIGTDITSIMASGTVTIPEGASLANILFVLTDDTTFEPDETVILTLTTADGATLGAETVHTVTITDPEDVPPVTSFDAATDSTDENLGPALLTVELSEISGFDTTVPYSISGGTAVGGGQDYTATPPLEIVIPAGTLSADISLALNDDLLDEEDAETIIVDLGFPDVGEGPPGTLGANPSQTHSILDDDASPGVSFTNLASSANEGDGATNVAVEIDAVSERDVTINYVANVSSTAENVNDYTMSGTVTIFSGFTSESIVVTLIDDVLSENDEFLVLNFDSFTNGEVGAGNQEHTLTIADSPDPLPELNFDVAASAVGEGAGDLDIVVELSTVSGRDVTVNYSLVPSGATPSATAADATDGTGGSITIPAGSLSETLTIDINDDASDEPDEDFIVTITSSPEATIGATNTHTMTVTDNDDPPVVTFVAPNASNNEATGAQTINVQLSAVSAFDVTVDYSITGSATIVDDFTDDDAGSITILAGNASAPINVTFVDETTDEPDETVVLTITSAGANGTVGAANVHTLTILNDDVPPEVDFDSTSTGANEASGTVNVIVELSEISAFDVSVNYALGGTATEVDDYSNALVDTVVISAGSLSNTIPLGIVDDAIDEGDDVTEPEDITLTLTGATKGTVVAGPPVHTVTVNDNDAPPVVQFATATLTREEDDVTASIVLSLDAVSGLDVTVDYTIDLFESSASDAGVDFTDVTTVTGQVTIPALSPSANIELTINDDTLDEKNETVEINLDAADRATLGAQTNHVLTINDNDEPPEVLFETPTSSTHDEADGTQVAQVKLSTESGLDVTIPYSLSGTAVEGAGNDYLDVEAMEVVIPAGSLTFDIPLAIIDDALHENDETIILTIDPLTGPVNSGTNAAVDQVYTMTVEDNDPPPAVDFSAATSAALEGAGSTTIAVEIDAVSGLDTTIGYVLAGTAAGAGVDYSDDTAGSIVIPAGSTTANIELSFTDDTLLEIDETVELTLNSFTNGQAGALLTHTFTLEDQEEADGLEVSIVATDNVATEGEGLADTGLYTVTMNGTNATGSDITVNYTVTGSAINGVDYSNLAGTALLADGSDNLTIEVVSIDDGNLEVGESVTVTLTGTDHPSVSAGTPDNAKVSILDDETVNGLEVTVSATDADANEDGTDDGEFTVSMSGNNETGSAITVNYTVSGTAGNGIDYTTLSGTTQINDGQSTKAIAVVGLNDGLLEGDEEVTLELQSTDNVSVTVGAASQDTVEIFDDETNADDDGDGLTNIEECPNAPTCIDTDGDGLFNYLDGDDDGDGISTLAEGLTDTDGDSVLDYLEPNFVDVDGDGEYNVNDADDDNDGTDTSVEVGPGGALDPVDTDSDGIADYLDASNGDGTGTDIAGSGDSDADGISDAEECDTGTLCADSDRDTVPNYGDPDDDNDGILTIDEGPMDSDGDGFADHLEPNELDTDGDGTVNYLDGDDDNDGTTSLDELGLGDPRNPGDVDADGIPDHLDASNGDGSGSDLVGSGDSDGDGLADGEECPSGIDCPDNEGDNIPDYSDSDDDNDGVPTAAEAAPAQDTDGDLTPDYLDNDDDGDGILTKAEDLNEDEDGNPATNPTDLDGDGISDYLDNNPDDGPLADPDEDGLTNEQEADLGTDPNDADSDGDGVVDGDEVDNGTDPLSGLSFLDSDGDLVPDVVEVAEGSDANNDEDALDSDAGGVADYIETTYMVALGVAATNPNDPVDDFTNDSDADGLPDGLEVLSLDSDPNDADNPVTDGDADSDNDGVTDGIEETLAIELGIPDVDADTDFDGDGYPDVVEVSLGQDPGDPADDDADGDGVPDRVEIQAGGDTTSIDLETDSDADGMPDAFEIAQGSGVLDANSPTANGAGDDDLDSIPNAVEAFLAANGGLANTDTSTDTDGDGITDVVEVSLFSDPFVDAQPVIRLFLEQGDDDVLAFDSTLGDAIVGVDIANQQSGLFTYDWSASDSALLDAVVGSDSGPELRLSLPGVTNATYDIRVSVTREVGGVVSNPSTLSRNVAVVSDGDAAAIADNDQDGVVDSLDGLDGDRGQAFLMQTTSGEDSDFVMEANADLVLRLGSTALAAGNNGTGVSLDDLENFGDGTGGPASNAGTTYSFSGGIFDFEVEDLSAIGEKVKVVIPQLAAIPANAVYRKFDPASGWRNFSTVGADAVASASGALGFCPGPDDSAWQSGLNAGDFCVRLTIVDGGPNDTDGAVNGSVSDPGGVGVAPTPPPPPPPPPATGGSGGGSLGWLWLALLAAPAVRRRRLNR